MHQFNKHAPVATDGPGTAAASRAQAPIRRKAERRTGAPVVIAATDRSEVEADRIAAAAVSRIRRRTTVADAPSASGADPGGSEAAGRLQRKVASPARTAPAGPRVRVNEVRRSLSTATDPLRLQRSAIGPEGGQIDAETETAIRRSVGRPLSDDVRQPMEQSFGADFSSVRIHTDPNAGRISRRIQAKAFNTGSDIFFSDGQYSPGTSHGQELIAHELAHVVQQQPGSPVARTVHRKIGFEIETGIPITSHGTYTDGDSYYEDPGSPANIGVSTLPDALLQVDHIPGHTQDETEDFKDWPIIELVTKPVPDDETLDDFRKRASVWIDTLATMRAAVDLTPAAVPLTDLGGSRGDIFVGFHGQKMTKTKVDRIAPQATIGAKLVQMSELMANVGKIGDGFGTVKKGPVEKAKAAAESVPVAKAVLKAIKKRMSSPRKKQLFGGKKWKDIDIERQLDDKELEGLLVLIANYLVAGRMWTPGLNKNLSSIFYKSKLSSVVNDLKSKNPFAAKLFGDDEDRQWFVRQMTRQAGRNSGEYLVRGDKPIEEQGYVPLLLDDWMEEITTGTGDSFFDQAKNPYADEIAPESVDGSLAAVVELRELGTNFVLKDQLTLSDNPAGVLDYLVRIFVAYQAWENMTAGH